MIIAGIALLAAAPASASPGELFDRITADVAAERISRCGLGPVRMRYDDLLQSEVLSAEPAPSVTDDQLECADIAASYYGLELPPSVQRRYDAIREARMSAHHRREARAWLSARGLLARVPPYEPGVSDDAEFTRAAEQLCGPAARGAFQSGHGLHVISPEWLLGTLRSRAGSEAMQCLLWVASVSNYEVGFIGNEAVSDPR